MTANLATGGTAGNSPIPLEALVKRHKTQTSAAKAWGVSQSAISRLLSGERGSREGDTLRAIARVEGTPMESILLPPIRRLQVVESDEGGLPCFVYDIDDPHWMLKQVQGWFSNLPPETRMTRQVVRAVMRVLFDESFDTIHHPSREWRAVMRSAEGTQEVSYSPRTRAKGPR